MRRLVLNTIRALAPAVSLLVTASCAVNPATGERQLVFIGEGREIQMGRDYDQQITASMGLYDDAGLQQYLQQIGSSMAAQSERPNLPWSFKLVDDPIVNAFALPGGFIYITRGIMAHFDSEAQLASVVGHEIGHVTAKHSVEQLSRAQLAQVGLVAGVLIAPEGLRGVLGAASAGMQLLFLKFGRADERQADDLGLRYITRASYDAREMPGVFAMLGRVSAASGGGRTPEWLSTHPNPENRERRLQNAVAAMPQSFEGQRVERESYLRRLDGMVFGEDPRDGYFEDQRFLHPRMAFQFSFPQGWLTQNQRQAVVGANQDQNTMIQLSVTPAATPDAAANAFLAQEAIQGSAPRATRVNGLRANAIDFQATTDQGTLPGTAIFVAHRQSVFQILGYGTTQAWSANQRAVRTALASFAELTDRAALDVQPMRLDIVQIGEAMTLSQFARRYPSEVGVDRLALINQVDPDARLEAGRLVKRVVRDDSQRGERRRRRR